MKRNDVDRTDGVGQDPGDDGRLVGAVRETGACALPVDDKQVADANDGVGAAVQDRAARVAEDRSRPSRCRGSC